MRSRARDPHVMLGLDETLASLCHDSNFPLDHDYVQFHGICGTSMWKVSALTGNESRTLDG
jgi:hypothetical protein